MNGLGVAVPSNAAVQLLAQGPRPSLGVVLRPVRYGLMLLEVQPGGAAAGASLGPGDVILGSFDDLSDALESGREVNPPTVLPRRRLWPRPGDARPAGGSRGGGLMRLLIAAESAVVRAGLEALAASSPGVRVLGSFPDYSQLETLRPDVVLAALPLDDLPASEAAVVLLTGEPWTAEAVRAGVRAILPQSASAGEILAALEAAAAGLAAIDPRRIGRAAGLGPSVARLVRIAFADRAGTGGLAHAGRRRGQ